MYALDSEGEKGWSFETDGEIRSSPAIGDDGTVYFGTSTGKVYALDPNGTEKWNFTTGGSVSASPTISGDGTVYFGSHDNHVYAVDSEGEEKWNFETGGPVTSSLSLGYDGTIYAGSEDGNLYAIDSDGTEKWRFNANSPIKSSPAISISPLGSQGVNSVYVTTTDGKLHSLSLEGEKRWDYDIGAPIYSSPVISKNGTRYIGSEDGTLHAIADPHLIEDWHDLDEIRDDLGGNYFLVDDLDNQTDGYDELVDTEDGWDPIGDEDSQFTGTLKGVDKTSTLLHTYGTGDDLSLQLMDIEDDSEEFFEEDGDLARETSTITGLQIDRPSEDHVGLFGDLGENATVEDVTLQDVNVTGHSYVGGLAGESRGTVENVAVEGGEVHGEGDWETEYSVTGGLIGLNRGDVVGSYSTADVTGDYSNVGGLVGLNWGEIKGSYAAGDVEGSDFVGGLVGRSYDHGDYEPVIKGSYATGNVTGSFCVGGLVGDNKGIVENSYSEAKVNGDDRVGGLVGHNVGRINHTYAIGDVSGDSYVGGLVGYNHDVFLGPTGEIIDSFSLQGTAEDVVGASAGDMIGRVASAPEEDMQNIELYTADEFKEYDPLHECWDVTTVGAGESDLDHTWNIVDGETYPFLSWEDA